MTTTPRATGRPVLERLREALRDRLALELDLAYGDFRARHTHVTHDPFGLVHNDLDRAFGDAPLTPDDIARLTHRLRRTLRQLITDLTHPSESEAALIHRARRVLAEPQPQPTPFPVQPRWAPAPVLQLRRLALVTLDLIDHLTADDDV
ncbi:DUF6415 family natural product biosynthesis protein [Streptomyces sp. NPDC004610]|uniref:DUF6415 family natural product biosynthesis protein n=1 Tax=unclassified Streptomyces TaxID=2593676 RepID=UPI0033AC7406